MGKSFYQNYKGYRDYEKLVNRALELIRKGYNKERILRILIDGNKEAPIESGIEFKNGLNHILEPEDIFEVAHCRIRAGEKFGNLAENLFFDEDGLRYSTPRIVAEYRAKRLNCETIADISCGVGAQLIFFAKHCKKVYGIEINRKRAFLAHLNAMSYGLKNVEILEGDAFDDNIVRSVKDADIYFSDPARPPSQPVRTIDVLEPNPIKILDKYGYDIPIAFELPPQMPPSRVTISGEKEYVSLNFKLNRMAVYTNDLAEVKVSVVSLPSGERVTNEDRPVELEKGNILSNIYEVDPSVIKAELLPNLVGKLGDAKIIGKDKRRTILSSDDDFNTSFLRKYTVLDVAEFNISTIRNRLKKLNAGKVTVRFQIEPSEYWNIRNKIEKGLKGDKWVYLFQLEDKAVITQHV